MVSGATSEANVNIKMFFFPQNVPVSSVILAVETTILSSATNLRNSFPKMAQNEFIKAVNVTCKPTINHGWKFAEKLTVSGRRDGESKQEEHLSYAADLKKKLGLRRKKSSRIPDLPENPVHYLLFSSSAY